MSFVAVVVHALLLLHYFYGLYEYHSVVYPPELVQIRASFGGCYKFLTYLDVVSSFIHIRSG